MKIYDLSEKIMPNVSCTFFKIHCVFYERVQTDIEDILSEAYKVTFLKNK